MIHFFCQPDDEASLWLASQLSAQGQETSVNLPEELLADSDFSLTIIEGIARPYARLSRGVEISVENTTALVSRLRGFPPPHVAPTNDSDLIYASEEIRAALVGWFHAWDCPVFGRPEPYSAWGDGTSPLEMRILASGLGLATRATIINEGIFEEPTDEPTYVICIGEAVLSSGECLSREMQEVVLRLAALSADSAPCFRFARSNDGLSFDRVEIAPDYQLFGDAFVDACVAEFSL